MTDALVLDNIRLVEYCARPFRVRRDYEDVCAHGRLGLVLAASRFNGEGKFASFAVPYIRGYILNYINLLAETVRDPAMRTGKASTLVINSMDAPLHDEDPRGLVESLVDDQAEDPAENFDKAAMPAAMRAEIGSMPSLTCIQRKRLLGFLAGDCTLADVRRYIMGAARKKLQASDALAAYWRIASC
jgi:DNA-directed RNA polymerase sigma subunit (sigma70/sigma32)